MHKPARGQVMNGWGELPGTLLKLAVAFLLGIPVGVDREHEDFGPGLRTYPLLAMGACGYIAIGQFAFRDHVEAQARVFQALVSGIGFIGAGAIIKGRTNVHGLATAVSLWVTVSVGIAAAYRLFALAAALSATTLIALRLLKPFKQPADKPDRPAERESSP